MLRLVSFALAASLAALGAGTTPTMAAPMDGQTTKPWVGAHTGVQWKRKIN